LFVSVCVFTHALVQRVCPMGHVPPHIPATHVAVPPVGARHALPQRPQWATAVLVLASQPLAVFMSQSAKPALHMSEHIPALHVGVPLAPVHALPQRPQCMALELVSTSQPLAGFMSQSAKPTVQRKPHVPAEHVAVELGAFGQALSQRPQCMGLLCTSTQLAPQRTVPMAQLAWHIPPLQT
jgi:hypothetical protein